MMKKTLLLALSITLSTLSIGQNSEEGQWSYSNRGFIENQGQFVNRDWNSNRETSFAYIKNPFNIFFSKKGVTYRFDRIIKNPKRKEDKSIRPKRVNISELVSVEWIDANPELEIIKGDELDHTFTYAMVDEKGEDYDISGVKAYDKITYKNVYDNIDIIYTIHPEAGVKYNVILYPGADPSDIKFKYSGAHTEVKDEKVEIFLNDNGQLEVQTSLGKILEHAPITFYTESNKKVNSTYKFENNILSFDLEGYDNTKSVTIDPWVVSPTYSTSTAAWEVETDGVGNVYSIGGETPMELKKFDINGNLQWTYVTPWDTNSVWLGTLATDANGNSYVTSGVEANMHKVDNAGNQVWTTTLTGSIQYNSEWWSITFNCDESQLLVGGTWVDGILSFDFYAGIFEIDVANGNVISDQTVDYTNIGGFGANPIEVRSIASSPNSRYIFLTHNDVGAINQNFAACPQDTSIFQVDNQDNLGYKCENYLPETQNGGGLKALVAGTDYFYTHAGDEIRQWDITDGTLINTVALPGGVSNTVPLIGGIVVSNSGLDIDDCGNVYAGATDRVVKFDPNLNIISSSNTSFAVYDVSVNSNGEVLACGAQQDNGSTNRNGRIEAINMSACAQYSLTCCDANFCQVQDVCESDAAFPLTPATPGGTWSGNGVDASGNFDPSVAGAGSHDITYTLPCGSSTVTIVVDPCTSLDICVETNGDLTVTNGTGPYTWEEEGTVTTPITNQTECQDCGYTWTGINCVDGSFSPVTDCSSTGWVQYATGTTTTPPGTLPIQVSDNGGASTIITDISSLPACNSNPCAGVTINVNVDSQTDVTCNGDTDGTATVSASGGDGNYTYIWSPGSLSGGSQTGLAPGTYTIAVQDGNGCTGSGTVTIGEPTALVANPSSNDATCGASDGQVSVAPSGGDGNYTYSWSPGGQTTATVSNVAAGSYDVTITDGNGCSITETIQVTTTNGPTISVDASADASCFGESDGSATVSATGGTSPYTFTWTPGGLTGPSQNSLSAGTYTVEVVDDAGCVSTTTVTIDEPSEIVLTTSSTSSSCTTPDGSATVSATGGAGGYTYSWSPGGQTTATATNVGAGSYTVTVTDANGCTATATENVQSTNGPNITVDNVSDISCFGDADGSASISVTGGTSPYNYSWSPSGGTGASATGLDAGSYTVTVTDDVGCISTETITISEPDPLVVTGTVVDADCAASNGEITTTTTGGTGAYTYSWSPGGQTTADLTGVGAGTFDVTVTDDNGCTATETFLVDQGDTVDVNIIPDNATIQSGDEVTFDVTINPTVTNPTYTWTPSSGLSCTNCQNPTASPNQTTTYTVTVTSDEGCVGVDQATINVVEPCADPFLPTIFSPNEDGKNDQLCMYGTCIQAMTLVIYNRWGEKVFESSNIEDCWDGKYRGKYVNSGTYVYKVRYTVFGEQEVVKSGNLTVVR
tara:strand:- start:28891 stop:33207 length:4317 start_codon:yes stop_codon:yes gene_type:complete